MEVESSQEEIKGRISKRSKRDYVERIGSQLFYPYRAIGFITDSTPFLLETFGTENFVITVIGKSYLLFNVCDLLNDLLVYVFLLQCSKLILCGVGNIRTNSLF
jgi:hypothetical protein